MEPLDDAPVEPLDDVMVFFLLCGPGRTKGAGGKTHSGGGTAREPCWTHSGTVVEPWWNRSGTVVEPWWNHLQFGWNLVQEPVWHYVFLKISRVWGPDRLGPYIILRGDSTHAQVAHGPGWQRPGHHGAAKPKCTTKRLQSFTRHGSRILPHVVLEFYPTCCLELYHRYIGGA